MPEIIDEVVADIVPTVLDVRRAIHRRPELSGAEYETTELLTSVLRDHGLTPRVRTPKTGFTIDIGEGTPVMAFRADLDALPIEEPPRLPFASEIPGVMHACGHDAHAAIGLGLALAWHRLGPVGRVRFIFQPAEETFPGGAYELVREGALDGVQRILAFHVDPTLDTGRVGLRAGAITSSADRFYLTLEGPGGHTARPHATVDLIHAAGHVITQLPGVLSRTIDARSPLALVFGRVHGGSADNVIPTQIELSGTVRTSDRALWDDVPSLIEKLVHQLVQPFGARVIFHYQRGLPPVVNDAGVVDTLERVVSRTLGEDAPASTHLSMGAEDFARYLDDVPGALLRLGCREGDANSDLHSADFTLDEGALEVGLRVGLAALLELIGR